MKKSIIPILLLCVFICSCNTANYMMNTVIDRDGSAVRRITTAAESAYAAGDKSKNPFLFSPDGSWELTVSDSVTTDYPTGRPYVTICKKAWEVELLSSGLQYENHNRSLTAPAESLKKRFAWFYTYYDFEAVYPEITDKGDIPLDAYLDKREQALWFRGDLSSCTGLNGVELASVLGDIETKFWNWYNRSLYEVFYDTILRFTDGGPYTSSLDAEREIIFSENSKDIEPLEFTIDDLCLMLDDRFATNYFSDLYRDNMAAVDSEVEERTSITDLFGATISYRLTMPGKILSNDASSSNGGILEWNVDAWRVLPADYRLTATSRTPNYWAWFIALIVAALPVYFFTAAGKK